MRTNRFLALLLTLLLLFTAGCSSASTADSAPAETAEYTAEDSSYGYSGTAKEEDTAANDSAAAGDTAAAQTEQTEQTNAPKLIYTARMELQTTDFETAAAGLEELVAKLNGYFESNEQSRYDSDYRTASYVVRVPAENFQALCQEAGTLCTQTYLNRSMEDVSEQYADTEARLAVEQTKHDRLLTLLAQAENMTDIIELEDALAETEYEIDALNGALRKYDSLIGYSTVNIELREVYRVDGNGTAPLSFGEKLAEAFHNGAENARNGLESFLFFVVEHFFAILVWVVILVVLVRLILRRRRRKGEAAPKPPREKKKRLGRKAKAEQPEGENAPENQPPTEP